LPRPLDQVDPLDRQPEARRPAEEGEEHALGEHLADQAPAAGPQSHPHREVVPAVDGVRQQQIGDVGAGEEEEQNAEEKNPANGGQERRAGRRIDHPAAGGDPHPPRRSGPRIELVEPGG